VKSGRDAGAELVPAIFGEMSYGGNIFGTALFPRRLKMNIKKKPAKTAKKVKICPSCKKVMSKCGCK
jgi:hypothetical protein